MAELTREEVLTMLREKAKQLGSQKVLAFRLGVSEQYLSDVMNWRPIGPKILEALNVERATVYRVRDE